MKNYIITAVAAIFLSAGNASATVLDFSYDKNHGADTYGERGVEDGTRLLFEDTYVQFNAWAKGSDRPGYAYFDKGNAGLGVCGVLDDNGQCNPSNDDNLSVGDYLMLTFYNERKGGTALTNTISDLVFRDANHNLINDTKKSVLINNHRYYFSGNGGTLLDDIAASNYYLFAYDCEEYYIQSATTTGVEVFEPGVIGLLTAGLAGLVITRRRTNKA